MSLKSDGSRLDKGSLDLVRRILQAHSSGLEVAGMVLSRCSRVVQHGYAKPTYLVICVAACWRKTSALAELARQNLILNSRYVNGALNAYQEAMSPQTKIAVVTASGNRHVGTNRKATLKMEFRCLLAN